MRGYPFSFPMDISKAYPLVSARSTETVPFSDVLSRHSKTLLYFYPKDSTPGCTLEAVDFTRLRSAFESAGIGIVGASLDSAESHAAFCGERSLGIPLVADDGTLHAAFAVIGEKKNYGKTYVGVIRSTFLLDAS